MQKLFCAISQKKKLLFFTSMKMSICPHFKEFGYFQM